MEDIRIVKIYWAKDVNNGEQFYTLLPKQWHKFWDVQEINHGWYYLPECLEIEFDREGCPAEIIDIKTDNYIGTETFAKNQKCLSLYCDEGSDNIDEIAKAFKTCSYATSTGHIDHVTDLTFKVIPDTLCLMRLESVENYCLKHGKRYPHEYNWAKEDIIRIFFA